MTIVNSTIYASDGAAIASIYNILGSSAKVINSQVNVNMAAGVDSNFTCRGNYYEDLTDAMCP